MTKLYIGNWDMGIERFTFNFHGTLVKEVMVNIPVTHAVTFPVSSTITNPMAFNAASVSGGATSAFRITKPPSATILGSFAVTSTGVANFNLFSNQATFAAGDTIRLSLHSVWTTVSPTAGVTVDVELAIPTMIDVGVSIKGLRSG